MNDRWLFYSNENKDNDYFNKNHKEKETVSFEFTLVKCSSGETITLERLMEHEVVK